MTKMVRTNTPGVYHKGNRWMVTWQDGGRQRKESFRTYAEAREAKARRSGGDRRKVHRVKLGVYADRWIVNYRGRTSRGFEETTRERYREEVECRIKPYFGGSWVAEITPG